MHEVGSSSAVRALAVALSLAGAGCLASFPANGDGGVDVGDTPDLAGVFGPDDAAVVAQADLAGYGGDGGARYHPLGFAAANVHGPEMKLQKQDCRVCHGSDLTGGSAHVSCDSCHQASWRSTCTYCHGGANGDTTGLPPRDISGQTDPTKISFPAHAVHAAGRISNPFGCVQCHNPNLNVLTPGHIFDGTPGRAEVMQVGGLSPAATYDPTTKTCAKSYCHGNGQGPNGTIAFNAPPRTCHDCHADITTPARWSTMSGEHRKHLGISGVDCTTCHNGTVATDPLVISDKTRHLDGKRNIQFSTDAAGITYDVATGTCSGSCHGKSHKRDGW